MKMKLLKNPLYMTGTTNLM